MCILTLLELWIYVLFSSVFVFIILPGFSTICYTFIFGVLSVVPCALVAPLVKTAYGTITLLLISLLF